MSDTRDLVVQSSGRLFAELYDGAARAAAEQGVIDRSRWARLAELGLPLALVPEEAGGFGLQPAEALAVVRLAAAQAVPLPLAETMLANRLLAGAGLAPQDGALALAVGDGLALARDGGEWRLTGRASRVPWGRNADAIVAVAAGEGREHVVLLPAGAADVAEDVNLADEPRDDLTFAAVVAADAVAPVAAGTPPVRLLGAALRSVAMAGALARVLEMTTAYANERVQFGKPIGKFQAIQQALAVMAGHVAAAGAAADMAAEAVGTGALLPIAAAKVRCGEAAGIVAASAHQIHGAIGYTREHGLHHLTRRLWSWRDEFGNEAEWSRRIGRLALEAGGQGLWPFMTAA